MELAGVFPFTQSSGLRIVVTTIRYVEHRAHFKYAGASSGASGLDYHLMNKLMLILFCVSCFIFLATTISSSAFIVSSFTSLDLSNGRQPSRWNRMTWVIVFIFFSLGIVIVGGFEVVQAICTVAGFPLIFVCALLLYSIYKDVTSYAPMQAKVPPATCQSFTYGRCNA